MVPTPRLTAAVGTRTTRRTLAVVGLLAVVTLAGCSGITGLSGEGTPSDPGLVTDGETLTLDPAAGQTVTGRTDLEAGQEVAVRLRSSGDQPFLKSESTTVDEDGSFDATFNLSGVEPGTEFAVTVSHNGTSVIEADGRVTA